MPAVRGTPADRRNHASRQQLLQRVRAEFDELRGLKLRVGQVRRLIGLREDVCQRILQPSCARVFCTSEPATSTRGATRPETSRARDPPELPHRSALAGQARSVGTFASAAESFRGRSSVWRIVAGLASRCDAHPEHVEIVKSRYETSTKVDNGPQSWFIGPESTGSTRLPMGLRSLMLAIARIVFLS